ncbi:MAG: hypothetical protein JST81_05930 [Bacteroidetes bacterium]|nr:hypothetical protein [Bacteroidota bacterium]
MSNAGSSRYGQRKRFSDKRTEKRIEEHLTTKDDHISDDDIRNVITDGSVLSGENMEADSGKQDAGGNDGE